MAFAEFTVTPAIGGRRSGALRRSALERGFRRQDKQKNKQDATSSLHALPKFSSECRAWRDEVTILLFYEVRVTSVQWPPAPTDAANG
jgi:hypothetical protein